MGAKLELWWAGNRRWFAGKIADIDRSTGKVLIKYMDGDWKWHKLWQEAIRGVKLKQPKLPKPEAAPPQREERSGTFRSLGADDEPAFRSLSAAAEPNYWVAELKRWASQRAFHTIRCKWWDDKMYEEDVISLIFD